jgi:3-dehydroquinate synthase
MKTLETIRVDLGERAYPIRIGRHWIEDLNETLDERAPGRRLAVITHPALAKLWGAAVCDPLRSAGRDVQVYEIPEGETSKSLSVLSDIYDFLVERKYERRTAVIALGGGVVGDVAGFAAATYLRGVDLVQLPTTLLAMVDSSVGGKTGINHPLGKNLLGAFKQPLLVAIELDFLSTLPEAELRAGMAEVVKYGMIDDAAFFEFLEARAADALALDPETLARIVTRSCEIKAGVVAQDETEQGLRAILNFGHTFAHAAEALAHYGGLRHGEAVAAGMVAACRLGEKVSGFRPEQTHRLEHLLGRLGLPVVLPRHPIEDYLRVMVSDKKVRGGRLRFVIPTEIGRVEVRDDIAEATVREVLETSFASMH